MSKRIHKEAMNPWTAFWLFLAAWPIGFFGFLSVAAATGAMPR